MKNVKYLIIIMSFLFYVCLVTISAQPTSEKNEQVSNDDVQESSIKDQYVNDFGMIESLQYDNSIFNDDSYQNKGVTEYWIHAEYPFVEKLYPVMEDFIGGTNWNPREENSIYIRRIGDDDFPEDLFSGIQIKELDRLTDEHGVVFWMESPDVLYISIRNLDSYISALNTNPLLKESVDRLSRNPYEGSLSISIDPELPANDPDINNIQQKPLNAIEFDQLRIVNDTKISKYAFYYYFPSSIAEDTKIKVVVVGNGKPRYESYDILATSMRGSAEEFMEYCNKHEYAMIKLLIPGQAQYMKREYVVGDHPKDNPLVRPDIEILKIIQGFISKAEDSGLQIHDKVFITGFSNGGIQANVFSLLYPNLIEASAPGGAGRYIYPTNRLYDFELPYPMGVSDLDKIDGIEFDVESFKNVEQYIFAGAEDNNPNNDPLWAMSNYREKKYRSNFGYYQCDRVPIYANYLKKFGVKKVRYRLYEDRGHEFTDTMIEDVFSFFNSIPIE